ELVGARLVTFVAGVYGLSNIAMWNLSSLFRTLALALLALSVEVQGAQNKFGPEWILGLTPATILYAETTLFLPDPPSRPKDTLLIWVGLPTSQNDRYQQVLASYDRIVTFNPSTGKMIQTMSSSTRIIANWEKSSGRPQRFQTALECQDQCAGIINAHAFMNTTIRLSEPDPNWGNTVKTSLTWTPEPLTTFDRGVTWQIPTINIQQVSF
ncbi:hypothetical protein EG327_000829, partial [Venturia inaequalis]